MTREEEIKQQAEKKALEPSRLMHPYAKQYKVMSAYEIGFIEGAVWTDEHPHWISVEDELPEYDQRVLWCWDDGLISIGRVALDEQHIEAGYITHWMPMPQAPLVTDLNKKDLPPVSWQEGNILVKRKEARNET